MRVVSRYAVLANRNDIPVAVYSTHPEDLFKKYLFYSDSYNRETASEIARSLAAGTYQFDNIHFLSCNRTIHPAKLSITSFYDIDCGSNIDSPAHLHLPQLTNGGETY